MLAAVSKLPEGIKLLKTGISGSYTVLKDGSEIGSVRPESRSYRMHPKDFVMRWWQAKSHLAVHPLGVSAAKTAQGQTYREQVTHFNTRAEAIDALLEPARPQAG